MSRILVIAVMAAISLVACGQAVGSPSAEQVALQESADLYAIQQIEVKWHRATSKKDIDLMMSLWADDATYTIGANTYAGKDEIRNFWLTQSLPFKPDNEWVSDTPAYKLLATVEGDQGTLYFECHYVDTATGAVTAKVGADQKVARIDGTWLITNSVAASAELTP